MIRNSFLFLERVGERTERSLWQGGISDWNDFLRQRSLPGFGTLRKGHCDRQLLKAEKNLLVGNAPYFADVLPRSEHWRLYETFKANAVFLDIETSGWYGDVTVVGLYDGKDTKTMVKGINLDAKTLREELRSYSMLVTFNGTSFDLPVLERFSPGIIPFVPHVDLRHVCARLGLSGGLKAIERTLGISRPKEIKDILGEDAVRLWEACRATGEREFLERLVAYNSEDIINLRPIAEYACSHLKNKMLAEGQAGEGR